MAIRLIKRSASRRDEDAIIAAERAAVTALGATLRRLAGELPCESPLTAEFTKVAQAIEAAGVLGAYRLDALTPQLARAA